MKKFFSTVLLFSLVLLTACSSQEPMTEEEQAARYNLTLEQYRQEKRAAARMNMDFDEHIKMLKMEGKMQ